MLYFTHCNLLTFTYQRIVKLVIGCYVVRQRPMASQSCHEGKNLVLGHLHFFVFSARQGNYSRHAGFLHMEFLANQIGGLFCHSSVGHQFTTRNGNESSQSVTCLMIQTHDASAYAASAGIVVTGHQRSHSCIRSQDTRTGQ